MRKALTRRGWTVLAAGIVLYGLGELLGHPVLRALAAVAVAVVLVSAVLGARRLPLRVERSLERGRVMRGQPVPVRLTVTNSGRWWTPRFDGVDGGPVTVPALRPRRSATVAYTVTPQRRGELRLGPLRVAQRDPLGLTDRQRDTGGVTSLWVYPRVHQAAPLGAGHRRGVLPGGAGGGSLRGAQELRALREYVPGDELRHVHWKATAATGGLMVRDLFDPPASDLLVVLDTRPEALSADAFEEAVDFAASILHAATDAGHRARLRTTDGLDARGAFLEALCAVEQRPAALAHQPYPGTVVFVTGPAGADLGWLGASGRGVVAAVTPGLFASVLPNVVALSGADAAALTARWNAAAR
ncbi:DUF58 domain-containing protein [Dactylosporangium sp. CS-047395]|uniref:DUF58 domain-containing protein n=1 Tax=Dactylosporangium sp. CS-047395 TaxID=3239936 RepID=UPI003D912B43